MTSLRRRSRLPIRVRPNKSVIDIEEGLQETMSAEKGQVLVTKDIEHSRLPIPTAKSPPRMMNLHSQSPMSSMILKRSESHNENVPSLRVPFVDPACNKDRETKGRATRKIAGVESSCSSTFEQQGRATRAQCSAQTTTISGRKPDGICGLQRRQTDAAKTTRSANGITLRRTSSNGSERATIEIWEPWQRSSLTPLLVAKGSKTSLSRHHNVPCVEIGTKAQKDERERAFDMSSGRPRAAIAPQMTANHTQLEDDSTKPGCATKTADRNDSTLPDVRVDSIGEVKTSSAPKVTFTNEHPGPGINPRDSSLPELYSGPSSLVKGANIAERISCYDWANRKSSRHYGFPPGEERFHPGLSPQELVSPIEPDQDFTTQLGTRKPRQLTSTPEQMEKLRELWREDRSKSGFAGETRIKIRRALSKITRLVPGSQGQARPATLQAAPPEAAVSSVGHRDVANDLVANSCDANTAPVTQPPAELEATHLRDFRFPSRNLAQPSRHDQRGVERESLLRNNSFSNGEAFELSAVPDAPITDISGRDAVLDKSRARTPSLPVSPTSVLFAPTSSPLPPISPPPTSLSRAWSVLGTSSTARHELMASPLPPMPSRPQLNPRDHNHGRHALVSSSTYHRAGPFIYNEGHMRSLADFSLSEVQRYWLRAQADAQADVMEGWMPWGL